jgi:formylglycine-generating enzyme required for sulfatase activity
MSAGEFVMGSPKEEKGHQSLEEPQHKVTLKQRFAVSRFEVTFDEWDACFILGGCAFFPSDQGWGRGGQPVINVSWDDAQQYVRWLSKRTGKQYRLLSEAEWEYAARAGSDTAYFWGHELIGKGHANCRDCGSQWDLKQAAPVGSFAANAFGLHDMHGNVLEWVQDCVHGNYREAPQDGSPWILDGNCDGHVVRGGAWHLDAQEARAGSRIGVTGDLRVSHIGFRVAAVADVRKQWAFKSPSAGGESRAEMALAEGVTPPSNILLVGHRSRSQPSVQERIGGEGEAGVQHSPL